MVHRSDKNYPLEIPHKISTYLALVEEYAMPINVSIEETSVLYIETTSTQEDKRRSNHSSSDQTEYQYNKKYQNDSTYHHQA